MKIETDSEKLFAVLQYLYTKEANDYLSESDMECLNIPGETDFTTIKNKASK